MNKVVIATSDAERALSIIRKAVAGQDELEIHYVNKYAPTVIYLLDVLRENFGWIERERGFATTENTRCLFNQLGVCSNKKIGIELRCTSGVKKTCKYYKRASEATFEVNTVTIEKAGGIRGL